MLDVVKHPISLPIFQYVWDITLVNPTAKLVIIFGIQDVIGKNLINF